MRKEKRSLKISKEIIKNKKFKVSFNENHKNIKDIEAKSKIKLMVAIIIREKKYFNDIIIFFLYKLDKIVNNNYLNLNNFII